MKISKNYERLIITRNKWKMSNNLEVDTGLGNANDGDYFFKVDRGSPMARIMGYVNSDTALKKRKPRRTLEL